jgi:hypothetical protein
MEFAFRFSGELDFSSYENALEMLIACNAFNEPDSAARLKLPSALGRKRNP